MQQGKFQLDLRKTIHSKDLQGSRQVVQGGCRTAILGYIQTLFGQSPEQSDLTLMLDRL